MRPRLTLRCERWTFDGTDSGCAVTLNDFLTWISERKSDRSAYLDETLALPDHLIDPGQ